LILSCDNLTNTLSLLKELHLLGAANTASKREDTTLTRVGIRRRVSDAKWAVNAVTILNFSSASAVVIMARFTEVSSAKAAEESY
jgi:hypothetical protein